MSTERDADQTDRRRLLDIRKGFLDIRRRINAERMDRIFAPIYDDNWGGYVNPTHASFVDDLIERVRRTAADGSPDLLDAACGTGKYWPRLLEAGCTVVGVDHSAGMLAKAYAKHPDVPTYRLALQDLAREQALADRFDGVLCVDAMENVGPEDWPFVLAGLRASARPGAVLYLTVEQPEAETASADPSAELVEGEVLNDGAYHYFPAPAAVERWLDDVGCGVLRQEVGDGYAHILCVVG